MSDPFDAFGNAIDETLAERREDAELERQHAEFKANSIALHDERGFTEPADFYVDIDGQAFHIDAVRRSADYVRERLDDVREDQRETVNALLEYVDQERQLADDELHIGILGYLQRHGLDEGDYLELLRHHGGDVQAALDATERIGSAPRGLGDALDQTLRRRDELR